MTRPLPDDYARLVRIARRTILPFGRRDLALVMNRAVNLAVRTEAQSIWEGGMGLLPPGLYSHQGIVAMAALQLAHEAGEPRAALTASRIYRTGDTHGQ